MGDEYCRSLHVKAGVRTCSTRLSNSVAAVDMDGDVMAVDDDRFENISGSFVVEGVNENGMNMDVKTLNKADVVSDPISCSILCNCL